MSEQKTTPSEVHTPPLSHLIAELVGMQIGGLGYPCGMGIPPAPEDRDRLAQWIERLVAKHPDYAAVNERPALLSRLRKMEEALRAAQGLAKIARELTGCPADDDYVEQVSRQIDAALSE